MEMTKYKRTNPLEESFDGCNYYPCETFKWLPDKFLIATCVQIYARGF